MKFLLIIGLFLCTEISARALTCDEAAESVASDHEQYLASRRIIESLGYRATGNQPTQGGESATMSIVGPRSKLLVLQRFRKPEVPVRIQKIVKKLTNLEDGLLAIYREETPVLGQRYFLPATVLTYEGKPIFLLTEGFTNRPGSTERAPNLRERLATGNDPVLSDPSKRDYLVRQLYEALNRMHSAGVYHRDIKPENILVNEIGQVKIIDFGISRTDDNTAPPSSGFSGTPAYISPGQAIGNKPQSSDDVFSLRKVAMEIRGYGQNLRPHVFWRWGLPIGSASDDFSKTHLSSLTPHGRSPFDFKHALELPGENPRVSIAEWLRFTKDIEEHARARELAERSETDFYNWFYNRFSAKELALEVTSSLDAIKHFPHNLPPSKRDEVIREVIALDREYARDERVDRGATGMVQYEHGNGYIKEFLAKIKTLKREDGTSMHIRDFE